MGLSVVSQTRWRIDVFPAFALPITRTRNWIFGIRRLVRSVDIGAMVFGFGKARVGIRVIDGTHEQVTCLSSHTHSEPRLTRSHFPAFRPSGGFKHPIKTPTNHFDFVFGDVALKPSKNASSAWSYGVVSVMVLFGFLRTRTTRTPAESTPPL
jgi:hypothetical protein